MSIEPDVIALEELRQNLKLSKCDNVWVLDKPILSEDIDVFFGPNQNLDWLNEQGLGESVSQARLSNEDSRDYKVEGICLSTLNKTIGNFFPFSEVSFVKVDIEGGEEFILEDVIKMAEEYKWSLWISFHIDWWKDKNLERFRNILNRSKKIKFNSIDFIEEDFDIIELLSSNPFASVYIEF